MAVCVAVALGLGGSTLPSLALIAIPIGLGLGLVWWLTDSPLVIEQPPSSRPRWTQSDHDRFKAVCARSASNERADPPFPPA